MVNIADPDAIVMYIYKELYCIYVHQVGSQASLHANFQPGLPCE